MILLQQHGSNVILYLLLLNTTDYNNDRIVIRQCKTKVYIVIKVCIYLYKCQTLLGPGCFNHRLCVVIYTGCAGSVLTRFVGYKEVVSEYL